MRRRAAARLRARSPNGWPWIRRPSRRQRRRSRAISRRASRSPRIRWCASAGGSCRNARRLTKRRRASIFCQAAAIASIPASPSSRQAARRGGGWSDPCQVQTLVARRDRAYLASGEWRGKAGGYAIQGLAATFVERLVGSYSNVVGLPLAETAALLAGQGYHVHRSWDASLVR